MSPRAAPHGPKAWLGATAEANSIAATLSVVVLAACVRCTSGTDPSATRAAASASAASAGLGPAVRLEAAPPGAADQLIRKAVDDARRSRRRVVVYLGASWCEPCRRFHEAAERGELDTTFPNVTFLTFDADVDQPRLAAAGYEAKYIPLFALPRPDGRASGAQLEGGIKGDRAVAEILPRLRELLAR